MSNALLEVTQKLAQLSSELAVKVQRKDLLSLEEHLERKRDTYYGDSRPAQAQIAAAIVENLIISDKCPTALLWELVRLARKADVDANPILERMVEEEAWPQVAAVYELQDMDTASWIVSRFCEKPHKEVARIITSHSWLPRYLDLERTTFAGVDAKEFAASLLTVLPAASAADYLQHALVPQDAHFINGLEIFLVVATPSDELRIIEAVAQFMQGRWEQWEPEPSYYQASDRRRAIEEDYSRCRALLANNPCTTRGTEIVEGFAALTATPFHEYRKLAETVVRLAELFSNGSKSDLEMLRYALQIIPPKRIHPAALRYLLSRSAKAVRPRLTRVLQTSPVVITGWFEGEPSVSSAPIFDPDGRLTEAYDPQCRVWPKNQAVASLLFTPIENCRKNFSQLVANEWNRDEDALSERLVMQLFQELEKLTHSAELHRWISERYIYGRLKISEPFIRDKESSWGADIGLVVEYNVEDTLHHQWCYLLQAKKAQGPRQRPTRWDIDREQLNDLLLTTSAGFYLLYSPLVEESSPFVLPARTILSALEAVEASRRSPDVKVAKSIPYSAGRDLAKSWASFMLEDVIGAWSGDFDGTLIQEMQANGTLARVVFNIEVAFGRHLG